MIETEEERFEKLLDEYPQLRAVHNDPKATRFQKKLAAMPILKKMTEEIGDHQRGIANNKRRLAWCAAVLAASEALPEWQKSAMKLERNDCSRLHHLVSHLKETKQLVPELHMLGDDVDTIPWDTVVPFVVQHDWAAAFANAGDYADGGYKLPYEACAFEFRITGRSVTIFAFQAEGCEPNFTPYVQFGEYWVSSEEKETDLPAYKFALAQIKAICVALDAEVATHEVVRAPERLNKKREAEGRMPLYSYHVVNLARRIRVSNPSSGSGQQTKKRLHFRRGHWRHYAEFKTWVRWCLVGDPELGFIDKEYRL